MSVDPQQVPDPEEFQKVFEWFNDTVSRLEEAYGHLEVKFGDVNRELDEKTNRLNQMEENLKTLLGSMKPGVIMVDGEMRLTQVNPSAEKLLGISQADIVGKLIQDVFPIDSGLGRSFPRAFKNPLEIIDEDRYIRFKDKEFPANFKSSAVIDVDGNIIGLMETFSDLSSFKKLEEEMQQVRILGAMGEMAATVAHEIRNPLGGIGGYAGLLARDLDQEDPRRRLVDRIIQGVSSLNNIVSNMLVYTRKSELHPVSLNLCDYLSDILMFLEVEIESESNDIELIKEFSVEELMIEIDPGKFQQAMLNILQNSVYAVGERGQVILSLSVDGSEAVIGIKDDGCGMSQETLHQLFKPFFTNKEQGSGLGLAIAKKIIDLHRGKITVSSELEKGTTFEIRLKGVIHG